MSDCGISNVLKRIDRNAVDNQADFVSSVSLHGIHKLEPSEKWETLMFLVSHLLTAL